MKCFEHFLIEKDWFLSECIHVDYKCAFITLNDYPFPIVRENSKDHSLHKSVRS